MANFVSISSLTSLMGFLSRLDEFHFLLVTCTSPLVRQILSGKAEALPRSSSHIQTAVSRHCTATNQPSPRNSYNPGLHCKAQTTSTRPSTKMSDSKLLIMLGSGPGIGVGVSKIFASRGFNKIALLSRNAERLQVDAESVKKAASPGAEVKTYPVDLADTKAIENVLVKIEKELGMAEVVVYNASHLTTSKLFKYSEEEVEVDLKVCKQIIHPQNCFQSTSN